MVEIKDEEYKYDKYISGRLSKLHNESTFSMNIVP